MGMIAIDTLEATRELEGSGLDRKHAEAIVRIVSKSHDDNFTKKDGEVLKSDILKQMYAAVFGTGLFVAVVQALLLYFLK